MTIITIPIDPTAPQRTGMTATLHLGDTGPLRALVVAVDDTHAHFQLIGAAKPCRPRTFDHGERKTGG